MLGVLNARGEVAVVGRRGKQRVWDLAERWYPETRDDLVGGGEAPSSRRSASARTACGSRRARGSRIPTPTTARCRQRARRSSRRSTGSIHDRARAHTLWDFFYRLEMYVPKAKREYGYYVLPILNGDRVVGRIEPLHDRKTGTLEVLGTWWEDKPVGDRPAAEEPRALAGRESLTSPHGLRDPCDPRRPGA